ncbi:complement resistance protein TraT [Sulfurimonas hydrogeniphila]|nr:complement resistance protein TraT [Sulfurimonas hydrogeniphila]
MKTANKMNLKFDEARPVLEKALARSIAGVF